MPRLMLLTDASLDARTGVGFGAFLATNDPGLPLATLKQKIKVKQFDNTSSTKLELQTLLWACKETLPQNTVKTLPIIIYTDSQNIIGLPVRRSDLERKYYCARNGRRLNNAELYQEFFRVMDECTCQFIKVAGHKPRQLKNDVDEIFALVDKASRAALRCFARQ